jgi:hypothetical protein
MLMLHRKHKHGKAYQAMTTPAAPASRSYALCHVVNSHKPAVTTAMWISSAKWLHVSKHAAELGRFI